MDGRRFLSCEGKFVADLPVRYFGSYDSRKIKMMSVIGKIKHLLVCHQFLFASSEINYFFLKIICYLAALFGALKVVRLFMFIVESAEF